MNQQQFLNEVLCQNAGAVQLCAQLFKISQTIDDLHDGDKTLTQDDIKLLAWESLVELPSNAFYQANFTVLQPMVRVALSDWLVSTTLEQGSEHDQTLAFVLRDGLNGLVTQCAYLVGGYAWMAQVAPAIRQFFHDEPLDQFVAGLAKPEPQSEAVTESNSKRKQPAKRQESST